MCLNKATLNQRCHGGSGKCSIDLHLLEPFKKFLESSKCFTTFFTFVRRWHRPTTVRWRCVSCSNHLYTEVESGGSDYWPKTRQHIVCSGRDWTSDSRSVELSDSRLHILQIQVRWIIFFPTSICPSPGCSCTKRLLKYMCEHQSIVKTFAIVLSLHFRGLYGPGVMSGRSEDDYRGRLYHRRGWPDSLYSQFQVCVPT